MSKIAKQAEGAGAETPGEISPQTERRSGEERREEDNLFYEWYPSYDERTAQRRDQK